MSVVVEQDRSGRLYHDLMIELPKEKAALDSTSTALGSKRSPDHNSGHLLDSNLEYYEQGVTLGSVGGMVLNLYMDWRGDR